VIGIDPLYFWHSMSQDEVIAIMRAKSEAENEAKKRSWEQARIISFYSFIAFRGSKEIEKPEDLFKFSWDGSNKPKVKTSIKEIKKLKNRLHG
jgi:hypothetical protein